MEGPSGIPRRTVLKRLGAGAAIAWTAPVVMSLNAPAYAQGSPLCAPGCAGCGDPDSPCGIGPGGRPCLCFWDEDRNCVCGRSLFLPETGCSDFFCDRDTPCPPGYFCSPCCNVEGISRCTRLCATP